MARVAYMGRCIQPEIAECNYSARSRPVCGDDGLTYLNAAMLACRNRLKTKCNLPLLNISGFKLGWREAFHFYLFRVAILIFMFSFFCSGDHYSKKPLLIVFLLKTDSTGLYFNWWKQKGTSFNRSFAGGWNLRKTIFRINTFSLAS